jgi:hypothetical protein
MNPPVLPWHREAARLSVSAVLRDEEAAWPEVEQIIAAHDPHAANQETVRLLEWAYDHVAEDDYISDTYAQIRAHLAELRGKGETT